jgi:hypothetical protein
MNNILSVLCILGIYNFSLKLSVVNFKSRSNIILTTFIFSLVIFFIYTVNAYLFIFNVSSKIFSIIIFIISLFYAFDFLIKNYFKIYNFINNNFKSKLTIISIISFFILSYIKDKNTRTVSNIM